MLQDLIGSFEMISVIGFVSCAFVFAVCAFVSSCIIILRFDKTLWFASVLRKLNSTVVCEWFKLNWQCQQSLWASGLSIDRSPHLEQVKATSEPEQQQLKLVWILKPSRKRHHSSQPEKSGCWLTDYINRLKLQLVWFPICSCHTTAMNTFSSGGDRRSPYVPASFVSFCQVKLCWSSSLHLGRYSYRFPPKTNTCASPPYTPQAEVHQRLLITARLYLSVQRGPGGWGLWPLTFFCSPQ